MFIYGAVIHQLIVSKVLHVLDQGEDSFLGDPIWQTILWREKPKTAYGRMYDFLIRAPALRNQRDMLQYMDPHSQLEGTLEMIWKLWERDSGLQAVLR